MIAARYELALEALGLREDHRVLEVGCGYGVAVELMAERLAPTGRIHALDRSPKMIAQARRRNEAQERRGVASFEVTALQTASLPEDAFDRVLAIRVRDLWTDPDRTLPRLRRSLRDGGRLVAVLDAPRGQLAGPPVTGLHRQLLDNGFVDVVSLPAADATAVALIAGTTD